DNESSCLSSEDNESMNEEEEDENLNIDHDEEIIDQRLLIDTAALDAAIVDADAIADQEVISHNNNDDNEQSDSTSNN
ncbi:unnamed protein product, partial [Adineta steineri]